MGFQQLVAGAGVLDGEVLRDVLREVRKRHRSRASMTMCL